MVSFTAGVGAMLRDQVIGLYRRIMRLGKSWKAVDPSETATERKYIIEEAHTIFRENKHVRDEHEIKQFIQEGEARVEIALHYKNPYPRHVNFPQHMMNQNTRRMKGDRRAMRRSRPIYTKSLDSDS